MEPPVTSRHRIPVEGGESVVAVHHEAASTRWFVCCHGFLSDKSGSYEERCERAVEEGYEAVRFDFRGCGESDGAFVDQTLGDKLDDLSAVLAYFDPDTVALFGSSLGGAVALHATPREERVVAVVTRAPVTYTRALDGYRGDVEREGRHEFEDGRRIDGRFFADLDGRPFGAVADAIDVPVAVFHGADDRSVAVADSFEAVQSLSGDVLLERFAGEGHRFSERTESEMRRRLFDWLATKLRSRST
jgi:pimeloyl-ACP methyl ester carboxylesterase